MSRSLTASNTKRRSRCTTVNFQHDLCQCHLLFGIKFDLMMSQFLNIDITVGGTELERAGLPIKPSLSTTLVLRTASDSHRIWLKLPLILPWKVGKAHARMRMKRWLNLSADPKPSCGEIIKPTRRKDAIRTKLLGIRLITYLGGVLDVRTSSYWQHHAAPLAKVILRI